MDSLLGTRSPRVPSIRLSLAAALAGLLCSAFGSGEIVVTTAVELQAALTPANAGQRILVRAGVYDIGQALIVPDDATLVGEGRMTFDDAGLPTGIAPNGRTVLRSTTALVGDVLTLGDGSTLLNLVIEDALGRQASNPPLAGNAVAVSSRAPGDFVSALIVECEILNPNPPGIAAQGPSGRALVGITRNPNLGSDPPPHDGSTVLVEMKRSIAHTPGGGSGVFLINFSSHSEVRLVLRRNVLAGLDASGGVSRPDAVTGARTSIQSVGNLYRSESATPGLIGWSLIGGGTAPIPGLASKASTFNSLDLHSNDDTIDGFTTGVSATGGYRPNALSESSSSNGIDLDVHGLTLQRTAADFLLFGARSLVDDVSPGDENTLRMLLRKATGSGPRANQYADSWAPSGVGLGIGNELRITGTEKAFVRSNDDVDPIPPAEFFTEQK